MSFEKPGDEGEEGEKAESRKGGGAGQAAKAPPRLPGRRKETQEKMVTEKLRGSTRWVWGHELQNYNWSTGLQRELSRKEVW